MQLEKVCDYARVALKSGKVFDKPKDLERIAAEMGYKLGGYRAHGREVFCKDGVTLLTLIPQHDLDPWTARGVLRILSSGVPTFR